MSRLLIPVNAAAAAAVVVVVAVGIAGVVFVIVVAAAAAVAAEAHGRVFPAAVMDYIGFINYLIGFMADPGCPPGGLAGGQPWNQQKSAKKALI